MIKEFFSFKFIGSLLISLFLLFEINAFIVLVASLLYFLIFVFYNYKNKKDFNFTCLELLIYTLPFSFSPLIPQINFLSLFIVCQIILIIYGFVNLKKGNNFSTFVLLFLLAVNIIYFLSIWGVDIVHYEVIIKMNIFLLSTYIISTNFKITYDNVNQLERKFILVSLIAGVTIFLQYYFNKYLGIVTLGTQSRMGEFRQGFSGLFYDYSIMSIYMVGTAGLLIFKLFNKKIVFNKILHIALILLFVYLSALTSARSGLAGLFLSLVIFLLWKRNFKILLFGSIVGIPSLYYVLEYISESRGTTIDNDSGRFNNLANSLDYVYENPFFGSGGLGYHDLTNNMLPHNFILDFLTDFGIILFVFYVFLIFFIIKNGFKYHSELGFLFILYLFGAMFHASFINTHYIVFPIFIILALKKQ